MPANGRAASSSAVKIGANVRAHRGRQRKSRDELGHEVGVSRQQIARYEAGENNITIDTLERLAKALGCSKNDLLGD